MTQKSGREPADAAGCTIGVDVGTTSVKAVAVDRDGDGGGPDPGAPSGDHPDRRPPRARRRPGPGAGDPAGPSPRWLAALDGPAAGVVVTSMVPSITAVDRRGIPRLPGLLYGDVRARAG